MSILKTAVALVETRQKQGYPYEGRRNTHSFTPLVNNSDDLEKAYRALSVDEQNVARHCISKKHRERYITSHFILRKALAQYLHVTPEEVAYQYGKHGKPGLSEALLKSRKLSFNMSHIGDFALYAFSRHPVGIDLEKIRPLMDMQATEEYVLTGTEKKYLRSTDDSERLATFYDTWVRKEAVLKGLGTGLSIPLESVETMPHAQDSSQVVQLEGISEKNSGDWMVIDLAIHSDYASAVATQVTVPEIVYPKLDLELCLC